MSLGKYTSLEEARKAKKLERFIADNPSEGDKVQFEALLHAMTHDLKTPPPSEKT